jgi:hypothetical protein
MNKKQGWPATLFRLNFFQVRARYCAPVKDGGNILADWAILMGKALILHIFPLPLDLSWLQPGETFLNRLSHM